MADFHFAFKSVALVESSFVRPLEFEVSGKPGAPDIQLEVSSNRTESSSNLIEVTLGVKVTMESKDKTQKMKVSAKMVGIFQTVGEAPLEAITNFSNINGPAIVFPFVREVIASLTMKANIPPLLLPTMNFAAAYRSSQTAEKPTLKAVATTKKTLAKPSRSKVTKE